MSGVFWFFLTLQVLIPGCVLVWLFVDDLIGAWKGRPRSRSKASSRNATLASRWHS